MPLSNVSKGQNPANPQSAAACNNLPNSGATALVLPRLKENSAVSPFHPPLWKIRPDDKSVSPENRALGIDVYGQMHSFFGISAKDSQHVGWAQALLLMRLAADKPQHIFLEGEIEKVHLTAAEKNHIRKFFPEGLNHQTFTSAQYAILCEHGAGYVYAALSANVRLYPASTRGELDRLNVAFNKVNASDATPQEKYKAWHALFVEEREKIAMRSVTKHLGANGLTKVALIYGANHQWGVEDFSDCAVVPLREIPTNFQSERLEILVLKQLDEKKNPQLQLDFVRSLRHLPLTAVFLTEDSQVVLEILKRATCDARDFVSPEQLQSSLLD